MLEQRIWAERKDWRLKKARGEKLARGKAAGIESQPTGKGIQKAHWLSPDPIPEAKISERSDNARDPQWKREMRQWAPPTERQEPKTQGTGVARA